MIELQFWKQETEGKRTTFTSPTTQATITASRQIHLRGNFSNITSDEQNEIPVIFAEALRIHDEQANAEITLREAMLNAPTIPNAAPPAPAPAAPAQGLPQDATALESGTGVVPKEGGKK